MITDTHCHLYKEYYDNINEIIEYSEQRGVNRFINNGCNLQTSREVIELSKSYENMYCTIGLHPEEDLSEIDSVIEFIKANLDNKKFVAIGEIGLDYYWNKDNKEEQKKVFETQLQLAEVYNLPVIIHSRESTGDMLDILKKYNLKGIIHCFNGSVAVAKEYIKMGYKLGINGVITFNKCKLIDVIKEIGVNDLVYETDSPYLTPVPFRGKKNDPSYTNHVIDFIVDNLGISRSKLVEISNKNIKDIFDI